MNAKVKGVWLGLNKIWAYKTDAVKEAIDTNDPRLRNKDPRGMETGCQNPGAVDEANCFDVHYEGWFYLLEANDREVDKMISMTINVEGKYPYPYSRMTQYPLFEKMSKCPVKKRGDLPIDLEKQYLITTDAYLWPLRDCNLLTISGLKETGVQAAALEVKEHTDLSAAFKTPGRLAKNMFLQAKNEKELDKKIKLGEIVEEKPKEPEKKPDKKPKKTGTSSYMTEPVKPPEVLQEKWNLLTDSQKGTISYYYHVRGKDSVENFSIWKDITTADAEFTREEEIYFRYIWFGGQARAANRFNQWGGPEGKRFLRYVAWLDKNKKSSPAYKSWKKWAENYVKGRAT